MAYSFQTNINVTDNCAVAIYSLKELLKSKGWTVPLSTDGYFVDGYDRITQYGWGGVNNFNPNSWIVLRMPAKDGVQREFVIQIGSAGTSLNIKYSYNVAYSGGTTSTLPTAAGDQSLTSGGFVSMFATLPQYVYCAAGDDSDGYNFYMIGVETGSVNKTIRALFALDRLVPNTYPTSETDPYIFWTSNGSNNLLAGNISNYNTESTLFISGWFGKGEGTESFARMQGFIYRMSGGLTLNAVNQTGYGTNYVGGYTDILPIITGRASGSLSTPKGIKGTSSLFNWYCTTSKTGDTYQLVSSRDKIVFGDVLAPWNGLFAIV